MSRVKSKIADMSGLLMLKAGNLVLNSAKTILLRRGEKNPKSILVVRTGNLGDSWCALPALGALGRRFPAARIVIATATESGNNPHSARIFQEIGGYEDFLLYEPGELHRRRGARNFRNRLRREKFDLVVYLGQSSAPLGKIVRDLLFFRWAGITRGVGFSWNKPIWRRRILPLPYQLPDEATRLVRLLAPLGIATADIRWPRIHPAPLPLENNTGRPVICVHPTAKFPAKRWDMTKMLETLRLIDRESPGATFIVIGDNSARDFACQARNLLGEKRTLDLAGKTSYRELAAVLGAADLLLSLDSGPVHVAAAQGTAVVAIYSARDLPGAWHPYGAGHTVLRTAPACRGCLKTVCATGECLNSITPKMAARTVLDTLSRLKIPQD